MINVQAPTYAILKTISQADITRDGRVSRSWFCPSKLAQNLQLGTLYVIAANVIPSIYVTHVIACKSLS